MVQNAVRLLTIAMVAGAFAQMLAGCAVANSPAPSRAATRVAKQAAVAPAILALSPFEGACFLTTGQACLADSFPAEKERPSWRAAISPDGQNVVAIKGQTLVVYEIEARKWAALSLPDEGRIFDVEFSQDGHSAGVAIACARMCADGRSKYHIALLDLHAKRFDNVGAFVPQKLESFLFGSRKGEIFLATYCDMGCEDGTTAGELQLFDLARQSVVQRIALPDRISRLILSPNGQTLVFMDVCALNCSGKLGFRIGVLDVAPLNEDRRLTVGDVKFVSGGDLRRVPAHLSVDGSLVVYTVLEGQKTVSEIGVADLVGTSALRERILQKEDVYGVNPAGFDSRGYVIFTALGRGGELAYAASANDGSLSPWIYDESGPLKTGPLTCAVDCSKLVFTGRDSSGKSVVLFAVDNGTVRQAARLPAPDYHVQALSSDGRRALLDSFVLDLGNVPTVVDVPTGATLTLPVLEFDKAEKAAARKMP